MPATRSPLLLSAVIIALAFSPLSAQEEKEGESEIKPKQLVSNLENPSGLAVHEPTGHVFIASRWGVYRYNPEAHAVNLEIINSQKETDVYGKGTYEESTKFDVGPLGLAFLDDEHLVVGDGSRVDGDEYVRIYKIGTEPADEPLTEDKAVQTLGPIEPGDLSAMGEGNFFGVAVGAGAIFVSCNGDDTKGWVAKAEVKDGKAGELVPTIATKEATLVDAPVPVIFSLDGEELVIGQMGEMNVPGDALLTTYDPKTGELKKSYETGLSDICGLAYSPETKKLYATDFAWAEQSKGGLFELVVEDDEVTAKKILSLDKPAAIAFTEDGSKMYLTTFGTKAADDTSDKSPGGLYVIEAGL